MIQRVALALMWAIAACGGSASSDAPPAAKSTAKEPEEGEAKQ